MTVTGHAAAATILADLRSAADPARAASERAYLKSGRDFLGVSVPVTRRIVRAQFRSGAIDGRSAAKAAVASLWAGPFFECRRAAVEVLAAAVGELGPDDLPVVEAYVRDGETWAIVDPLAIEVAGRIVARGVDVDLGTTMDRWSTDPDSFWVRRMSLLALLPSLRAGGEEWPRFVRYADAMLAEREFFIRKAIGWALRQHARTDAAAVEAFVARMGDRLSPLSRREALRGTPAGRR